MPNRTLTPDELDSARALLAEIRSRLDTLSAGDTQLRFAYRRKIVKELGYDERSKPTVRNKLKIIKWAMQDRRCAHCGEQMELRYSELDRKVAADGTPKQTPN
jgi:NADH pyrophosphatase NudC (nudix superfamily)